MRTLFRCRGTLAGLVGKDGRPLLHCSTLVIVTIMTAIGAASPRVQAASAGLLSAAPQQPQTSLEELERWSRSMVENGQLDQLAVRFRPLLEAWQQAGDSQRALYLAQLWSSAQEESWEALRWQGDLQLELQDFQGALDSFQRALQLAEAGPPGVARVGTNRASEVAELYLGIALASWESNRFSEAKDAFRLAMEAEATPLVRYQWARFLHWEGDGERAYEVLEGLPAAMSGRPEVVLLRAKSCALAASESEGEVCSRKESIALFKQAVVLLPEHSEAYYGLARAYNALGDRENANLALSRYRELLKQDLDPTRPDG